MSMPTEPTRTVRSGPGFLGALIGIVFAAFGFLLMVGAVLLALAVGFVALIWSLLRGRKPKPVHFEFRRGAARAWRPASGRPPSDEVVDIEAREVVDPRPASLPATPPATPPARDRSENGQP
jgi:hypothetical protein